MVAFIICLFITANICYLVSLWLYLFMLQVALGISTTNLSPLTLIGLYFGIETGLAISFNLASWFFVAGYWLMAEKLQLAVEGKDNSLNDLKIKIVTLVVTLYNVGVCAFFFYAFWTYI